MLRITGLLTLCIFLAACGGGSGDSSHRTEAGNGDVAGSPAGRPGHTTEPPLMRPPPGNHSENSPARVRLSWIPPTARVNGEPLPIGEIHSYEIHYCANDCTEGGETVIVPDGSATEYTVDVPGPGVYHFAMIAVDTSGLASDNSNDVSVTVE